ncbi:S-adenosyl-L-methionine-dependent methyltransferase [Synechococcus sp. A18-46.1]|nr:S-adenosyl-L-methionine-dependent methyltransferase [Synechococcus sp. A18-46.1]
MIQKDYVSVIYDESERPFTSYPKKLVEYLFQRYKLKFSDKILDIGCGRGEFLKEFTDLGLSGFGVDQSQASRNYCSNAVLKFSDIESQGIPYDDDFFDVVYSKSVIEHFYYPEKMVCEAYRVLKPGGLMITLCPDWHFNYRIYFEDYTHRTPFMQSSLRDILLIHNFKNVRVENFRQLPTLWGKEKFLTPFAELTRLLVPNSFKSLSKWVRFSKEIMLLATATKPITL